MAKNLLYIIGVILLAVGIIGFFNNPIFGIFAVDTAHNVVHIITGLLTIVFASGDWETAHTYSKIMALVYALLFIIGVASPTDNVLGMVMNSADHVLHLLLAIGYLVAGYSHVGEKSLAHSRHTHHKV